MDGHGEGAGKVSVGELGRGAEGALGGVVRALGAHWGVRMNWCGVLGDGGANRRVQGR